MIAEELRKLYDIKQDIKSALEEKGLEPNDDFSTYPALLESYEIPTESVFRQYFVEGPSSLVKVDGKYMNKKTLKCIFDYFEEHLIDDGYSDQLSQALIVDTTSSKITWGYGGFSSMTGQVGASDSTSYSTSPIVDSIDFSKIWAITAFPIDSNAKAILHYNYNKCNDGSHYICFDQMPKVESIANFNFSGNSLYRAFNSRYLKDLSNLTINVSEVENMQFAFANSSGSVGNSFLTNTPNFVNGTDKNIDFNTCFYQQNKVTEIDLSGFGTGMIKLYQAFTRCQALTTLNFGRLSLDPSSSYNHQYAFTGCTKLTKIICTSVTKEYIEKNKSALGLTTSVTYQLVDE